MGLDCGIIILRVTTENGWWRGSRSIRSSLRSPVDVGKEIRKRIKRGFTLGRTQQQQQHHLTRTHCCWTGQQQQQGGKIYPGSPHYEKPCPTQKLHSILDAHPHGPPRTMIIITSWQCWFNFNRTSGTTSAGGVHRAHGFCNVRQKFQDAQHQSSSAALFFLLLLPGRVTSFLYPAPRKKKTWEILRDAYKRRIKNQNT